MAQNPAIAYKMGATRDRPLRHDWEVVKDNVMYTALQAKFTQHEKLKLALLATENAEIIEHTEKDSYWADGGDGNGKNMLGKLLMVLREELRNSK